MRVLTSTSQSSSKRRGCISASVGKQTPIRLTMFKCLQHCNFNSPIFFLSLEDPKKLPCWEFHEYVSLPLQVFRPCASRARLHRNLSTKLLTQTLFLLAVVSILHLLLIYPPYLNPQIGPQLELPLVHLAICALAQGLTHVQQVHREDIRVAVLDRLVLVPSPG